MTMVSFVLPVYNVAKYLGACVDTLKGQTDGRFEAILVDDGSTDGSGALCDELAKTDPRIRVIHQENAGSGYARNAGLRAATGKYVVFVDPDDTVSTFLIWECLPLAEEHGADIVVFGHNNRHYQTADGRGYTVTPLPPFAGAFDFEWFRENFYEAFTYNAYNVWLRFFRREYLLEKDLWFTNQPVGQDAVFMLDSYERGFGTICFIQKALYNHDLRDGSAVYRYQPKRYACELNIARRQEGCVRALGLYEDVKIRRLVEDRYVMAVSIEAGNLAHPDCPMTRREAAQKLRDALREPDVRRAVRALPLDYYAKKSAKLMLALLKLGMPGLLLALKRRAERKI